MTQRFGTPSIFAFVLTPLSGPPEEADASAALTWAALEIWAKGRNLSAHTHTDDSTVHSALHWPLIYISRWIAKSWGELFERQAWPLPELDRNARDLAKELDKLAVASPESDSILSMRDDFVFGHSLLTASGGGLVPDLYIAHDGDRVSLAWESPPDSTAVVFHHSRGEIDVPSALFVDAAVGLIEWVCDALSLSPEPRAARDRAELQAWLEYVRSASAAEANLAGFVGVSRNEIDAFTGGRPLASVFSLPDDWSHSGARFDASTSWPAVVFRASHTELSTNDVRSLIDTLAAIPSCETGRRNLQSLRAKLPDPVGWTDFEQGYFAAEAVRRALGNADGYLDIERLLGDLGVPIGSDIELSSPDLDGGCVWDGVRGPTIFVNPASDRAKVNWGRRMILAHELCHLLFDARAAVPLTVVSGPWAPPVIERRANAFAAELLLPLAGIHKVLPPPARSLPSAAQRQLMDEFDIGETVCRTHVENRLRLRRRL